MTLFGGSARTDATFASIVVIGRITERSECHFRQAAAGREETLLPPRISTTFVLLGVWVDIDIGKDWESTVDPAVVAVRKFLDLSFRSDRRDFCVVERLKRLVGTGGSRVVSILALSDADD